MLLRIFHVSPSWSIWLFFSTSVKRTLSNRPDSHQIWNGCANGSHCSTAFCVVQPQAQYPAISLTKRVNPVWKFDITSRLADSWRSSPSLTVEMAQAIAPNGAGCFGSALDGQSTPTQSMSDSTACCKFG